MLGIPEEARAVCVVNNFQFRYFAMLKQILESNQ